MIADEPQLEELLSRPSAADVAFALTLADDVVVLGAGGKMGPSLARRVRRALDVAGASRRVLAVARFSEPGLREALEHDGIETMACDLLDPAQVARLPRVGNVLFMAGRKFGSTDRPDLTWAQNVIVPSIVAPHFADSRIVVFSSGNVYPLVQPGSTGATERDAVAPVGEYAQTCVGRERVFEHASRERGTRCLLFRLFYAVDLRYGTLVDVARRVHAGEPVSLAAGHVNAIWQGDASSYAFRSLALCDAPPRPLVVTGPDAISVRDTAKAFGRRFGRPVRFAGRPGPALLGDASLCVSLLGPPEVPLPRLLDWVAAWVEQGGRSLGKPTHFEATDGRF
ncbi:MAG TPA: NAD-dependent epimerase/dehydratase family protein [Vicinamibacteria bacterium]|nr:NAD-dependent epimerase/dehydratase family protein [Vicinamibacteria bacterium]